MRMEQMERTERVAEATVAPSRRRGRGVRWSFVVAGLAIVIAVGYLVYANTRTSAEYYMTIPELYACTSCSSQSVRVAGVVKQGSVVRDDKTEVIHFVVTDSAKSMPVVYSGVVPDIFKPGIQVVVEGRLQDGTFRADNLLAKCPSKFQAATPGASSNPGN